MKQLTNSRLFGIAFTVSQFLRREVNKALAEVTGDRVNSGAGYGRVFTAITDQRPIYMYTNRIRDILVMLRARRLCKHKYTVSITAHAHPFTLHPLSVNSHGLWYMYFRRIELSVVQSREVSAI